MSKLFKFLSSTGSGLLVLIMMAPNAQAQLVPNSEAETRTTPVSTGMTAVQTDVDGWQKYDFQLAFFGSGVALDQLGKYEGAEVIYSGTAATPGNVAFTCHRGELSLSVAGELVDMKTMVTDPPSSRRFRVTLPEITIDGKRIPGEQWLYMPAMKVYRAREFGTMAKIYNAVVRGSDVGFRHRGRNIKLNLPPLDDTFKTFGAGCGRGVNA